MFGLKIVRYTKYIKLPKNEEYNTLLLLIKKDLSYFNAFFQSEVEKKNYSKNDENLFSIFQECHTEIIKFYREFNLLSVLLEEHVKTNDEKDFENLIGWFCKYRGIFLTTLHIFYDIKKQIRHLYHLNHFQQLDVLKEIYEIINKFRVLFSVSRMLEKTIFDGTTKNGKLQRTVFTFNPHFDITKIEFDNSLFYRNVGKQYYPEIVDMLNGYVTTLSGFYRTIQKTSHPILEKVSMATYGLWYSNLPKKKAKLYRKFSSSGDYDKHILPLLNMYDDPVLSPVLELFYDPIKISKRFTIEIPKCYQKKNEKEKKVLKKKKKKKWLWGEKKCEDKPEELVEQFTRPRSISHEMRLKKQVKSISRLRKVNGAIPVENFFEYFEQIKNFKLHDKFIHLRIISPFFIPGVEQFETFEDYPFIFKINRKIGNMKEFLKKHKPFQAENMKPDGNLLINIHGGGFVAQSSHVHEKYLRFVSKTFMIPIISIDYTNAPEHQFPTQTLQCYLAYQFAVNNAEKILGVPLKNVFLIGDSAGGNICTSVTLMTIADKFKKPDGLLLAYPSEMVSGEGSPSRIMCFVDTLVSKDFLLYVLKSYPNEETDNHLDPFISPVCTPDEILGQFPPTYINCASLDPLFDDAVILAKRLYKVNHGKVFLKVYDAMGHGFLSLKSSMTEASDEIKAMGEWIKKLCEYKEKNKM